MDEFFKTEEPKGFSEAFTRVMGNFESLLEGITSSRDSFREGHFESWEMGVVRKRLEDTVSSISDFNRLNK